MPFFANLFKISYYIDILKGEAPARAWLRLLLLTLATILPFLFLVYTKGLALPERIEPDLRLILDRLYPEKLEVTIKNGIASTNVPEPYFILISKKTFEGTFFDDPNNKTTYSLRLLTIDTKATQKDFEGYQTAVLLTSDRLIYDTDNGSDVTLLKEVKDMTISKQSVTQMLDTLFTQINVVQILRSIIYAFGPVSFIAVFIYLIFKFVWFALIGLIIKFIVNVETTYKRIWRVTICLAFIPDLFFALLQTIPNLPIWITTIQQVTSLFVFAMLFYLMKQLPPKVPVPKPKYD